MVIQINGTSVDIFPYQVRLLQNLKGERWKEIPGYEGYYEISDCGRVRSRRRVVANRWGTDKVLQSKIVAQTLSSKLNANTGDIAYGLRVKLSRDGQAQVFSVARLVYHVFIAPIDLQGRVDLVSCIDGDRRNLRPANLYLTDVSRLQKRNFEEKRSGEYFRERRINVTQYDQTGKAIARFESCAEAARAIGDRRGSAIASAVARKGRRKGFFWRAGHSAGDLPAEELKSAKGMSG